MLFLWVYMLFISSLLSKSYEYYTSTGLSHVFTRMSTQMGIFLNRIFILHNLFSLSISCVSSKQMKFFTRCLRLPVSSLSQTYLEALFPVYRQISVFILFHSPYWAPASASLSLQRQSRIVLFYVNECVLWRMMNFQLDLCHSHQSFHDCPDTEII